MPIPHLTKPDPGRENLETGSPLLPESLLPFRCAGCGSCCRGRRDLLLSGYDLYRLAVRLDLPPEVVAEGFCDRYTGPDTGFPALRLRPRKDTGGCPFLVNGRCAVHDARPLACALYPLGQTIALPEGTASYFMQDVRCGERVSGQTLARFLTDSGIAEREPIDIRWAEVCTEMMGWLASRAPSPLQLKFICRQMEKSLYFAYDRTAPFLPQFEGNVKALRRKLASLQIPRKDEPDENCNP